MDGAARPREQDRAASAAPLLGAAAQGAVPRDVEEVQLGQVNYQDGLATGVAGGAVVFPGATQDGLHQTAAGEIHLPTQTNGIRCAVHRHRPAAQVVRVRVDEGVQDWRQRLPTRGRRPQVAEQHDGPGLAQVIHLLLHPTELGVPEIGQCPLR
jgi:hypothetical protein